MTRPWISPTNVAAGYFTSSGAAVASATDSGVPVVSGVPMASGVPVASGPTVFSGSIVPSGAPVFAGSAVLTGSSVNTGSTTVAGVGSEASEICGLEVLSAVFDELSELISVGAGDWLFS